MAGAMNPIDEVSPDADPEIGMDWALSPETVEALREIDDALRDALVRAPQLTVGWIDSAPPLF